MSNLERDLIRSLGYFDEKLKRRDLIPATRCRRCVCGGDPDCRSCGGLGVIREQTYLNDWEAGDEPGK